MAFEKIALMLQRRPPAEQHRQQLHWLVDLVYACKASGNNALATEARIVEDALGQLGDFVQTGDEEQWRKAMARIDHFADTLKAVLPPSGP